ncbi:conserved Plasmodium protein, unknown function [Plasmodium gaboni]|uniref:Secreted ookinete protein n=1 Tax=Plasmodium gaboni TaxID=647221 RepID=A0ABY1UQ61_9APIC|nr:conserved Plasmodium protein, unknown function [Plasmodium gaboni]
MFRICPFLLFFLFYHSSYNIYFVLSWNKNGQPSYSNVSCSNDKLSYIYDNSKFILSELENILYDVRDQRNSHELENEYDKELDIQIKFPHNKDYHDLQILDDQYEEEKKYSEPVPYITISNLEEDSDDLKKSFINDNIYNEDTSTNRPLNEEEQIDIALSKIYELEEKMKMFKEHNGKQNLKKYLR